MRVTTTKSKNAESFYITHSYAKSKGVTTSKAIRKLGTLKNLSERLGTDWKKQRAQAESDRADGSVY